MNSNAFSFMLVLSGCLRIITGGATCPPVFRIVGPQPSPWELHNSRYYIVVSCQKGGKCDGDFAEEMCKIMGGRLVRVRTKDLNDFLWKISPPDVQAMIIDGRRKNRQWTYSDGEAMTYTDWESGQPSPSPADCVILIRTKKWFSRDCALGFVVNSAFGCEKVTCV